MKNQKNVNVIVVNTKGGAGKSTTAMQTISTYFLAKAQEVELLELDNQNQDAKIFSKSKIKSRQINVDANAKDLNQTIRDLFLAENKNNIVLDIGGNATTYNFLQSLKSTHMYNMVDLFVIPMSGGSQDLKNAKDTLEMILGMKNNAKILFVLSRVRNPKRVQFQYGDFFQNEELNAYNPFLLNLNPLPEMGPTERYGNAEITYFVLPHMSEIGKEDYDKTGGSLGWFQQQGFYVYRADRLLVAGDWLGLEKKRDYSKLARIAVNFSNSNDFDWNLDIKKSTATPPIEIRRELIKHAKIAIMKSAKIYNWRGQKTVSQISNSNFEPLWKDEITREGIKKYKINRKHPIINSLLADKNKLMSKALKLLEENVPIELILSNQNEDPAFHELEKHSETPSDDLLNLAIELYKIYVQQGIPESLAKQQIMSSTPFNLFPLINDYLK